VTTRDNVTEELHDPLIQMEILQPLEQEGEALPVVPHQAVTRKSQ
jgi:hypothetical protein